MTSRIPNTNKQQPIRLPRQLQRLSTPKLPRRRIIHVRSHIWTLALAAAIIERHGVAESRWTAHGGGICACAKGLAKETWSGRGRKWFSQVFLFHVRFGSMDRRGGVVGFGGGFATCERGIGRVEGRGGDEGISSQSRRRRRRRRRGSRNRQ